MNRVIHFEIPVEDPERAITFYQNTFGWKIEKWKGGEYWLIMTGEDAPGINGGMYQRKNGISPSADPSLAMNNINTIDVENIDEMIEKIKDNGGEIIDEKMDIPEVGAMAYCRDTEGNIFGIMQSSMPM